MDEKVLSLTPLFSDLTQDQMRQALKFFNAFEKHYAKGEFLNRLHAPLSRFGLVLSGSVQVTMGDMDGYEMIFAGVEKGGMFGESLCYLGLESPVRIHAVTACDILWLDADRIKALHPQTELESLLVGRFIAQLARRTLSMNDRIQVLSRGSIRTRVKAFLSSCYQKQGAHFTVPFSRKDLAVYLGVNRSALSRELSRMQQEGLITFTRNVFTIHRKEDFS